MSLTFELDTTALTLNCGILASKTSAILSEPSGRTLNPDDLRLLEEATKCLRDLIDGGETLSSGRSTAGVTPQSIKSLGLALNPLERLCKAKPVTNEAAIKVLSQMEETLNLLITKKKIEQQSPEIDMTRDFFAFVADSLLSSLNRARMPRKQSSRT